jgi:hypothetical protein
VRAGALDAGEIEALILRDAAGAAAGADAGADAAAGVAGEAGAAARGSAAGSLVSGFAAGAGAADAVDTSSPSAAMIAIGVLTATSCAPPGTRIFARMPSSIASTSIVALSVSISASTSPDLTVSPSAFNHLARLPFSIVGDSAGIRTCTGIDCLPESKVGSI